MRGFLLVIFHLDKPKPSVDSVDGWPFSLIFSLSCPWLKNYTCLLFLIFYGWRIQAWFRYILCSGLQKPAIQVMTGLCSMEIWLAKSSSKSTQVVGRIHFFVSVGLKALASYWPLAGDYSQPLEASHSSHHGRLITSSSQHGESECESVSKKESYMTSGNRGSNIPPSLPYSIS